MGICSEDLNTIFFTQCQWNLAHTVIQILDLFEELTQELKTRDATIPIILPAVRALRVHLRSEILHKGIQVKKRKILILSLSSLAILLSNYIVC